MLALFPIATIACESSSGFYFIAYEDKNRQDSNQ